MGNNLGDCLAISHLQPFSFRWVSQKFRTESHGEFFSSKPCPPVPPQTTHGRAPLPASTIKGHGLTIATQIASVLTQVFRLRTGQETSTREKTPPNIEMVLHQLGLVDHRFGIHPRWQSSDFWTINSITNLNFGSWFWPEKWTAQIWIPKKIWSDDTGWWMTRSWLLFHLYFVYEMKPKILGQNGSG